MSYRINQIIETIRATELFGNKPARIYRVFIPPNTKDFPVVVLTRQNGTNESRQFRGVGQSITLVMTIYSNRLTDIENSFPKVIASLITKNQLVINPDLPNEGYIEDSELFYQTTQLMLRP